MSWTCDKCREMFAYEDEVTRYDINWNFSGDAERNAQNPDNHAHTLCMTCDELRMKREEIIAKWDGLSPRERDAWVAEVVFGQSIGRERRINGEIFVIDANSPHGFQRAVPNYTTDISAAWAIVDANKTEFLVRRRLGGSDYRAWIMLNVYKPEVGVYAHGKTAPEAICLAALIAKCERYVTTT